MGTNVLTVAGRMSVLLAFLYALGSQLSALQSPATPLNDHGCTIAGRVTDSATGQPIEGADVFAAGVGGRKTKTDAEGRYLITDLNSGTYIISALHADYARSAIRSVRFVSGTNLKSFDLQLYRQALVSGTVIDEQNAPAVGAWVTAWTRVWRERRSSLMIAGQTSTDADGRFTIQGLGEGTYYVGATVRISTASKTDSKSDKTRVPLLGTATIFYPRANSLQGTSPLQLRVGEQHRAVDIVIPGSKSTFCARSSLSVKGMPTATIALSQISKGWFNPLGGGSTSPSQYFEMCGLVPGIEYSLTAFTSDPDSNAIGRFGRRDFMGSLHDAELGVLDLGVISVDRGTEVKGSLSIDGLEPDKHLPEGIMVLLEPRERGPFLGEGTEAKAMGSGEFVLPNVFADDYWIELSSLPSGFYVKSAEFNGLDLLKEPWRPGRGSIKITLGMDGASLAGRVIDRSGQPVSDGQVIIVGKDLALTSDGAFRFLLKRRADQGGQFDFASSVVPGSYRIFAVHGLPEQELADPARLNDYISHSTEIDLAPKEQRLVTLTLLD